MCDRDRRQAGIGWAIVDRGLVTPPPLVRYPLKDGAKALEAKDGGVCGKIILQVAPEGFRFVVSKPMTKPPRRPGISPRYRRSRYRYWIILAAHPYGYWEI